MTDDTQYPMLKVGIKFCGGCNPYYDRIALVERIVRRLKAKVKFVSAANDDLDLVLVVEGCGTACADLSPFNGKDIRIITQSKDADGVIQELLIG